MALLDQVIRQISDLNLGKAYLIFMLKVEFCKFSSYIFCACNTEQNFARETLCAMIYQAIMLQKPIDEIQHIFGTFILLG